MKSFENLMRSIPIYVLILPIPAQALEIVMACASIQEGKEMENAMLLVCDSVNRDNPRLAHPGTA
jgi:hypothetical protein